jgi:flagellar hook assembly protein FlgD
LTNIAFSLPRATEVEINVYNIRGQKIRDLTKGMMDSGNHVISWNGIDNFGKRSSTGIYFVSVKADGYERIVRKVTLLK